MQPAPEPQEEHDFLVNDDMDEDFPDEDGSEEPEDALEPQKPASSAVASAHVGGSRAFVPPLPTPKSEAEDSAAADAVTVSGGAAPSATAAKSSSGEAADDHSGGKGAVAASDGGSAPAPAPSAAAPAPLIIRDWGSVGGGFVPFGAPVHKTAPKGGKVLPDSAFPSLPTSSCPIIVYQCLLPRKLQGSALLKWIVLMYIDEIACIALQVLPQGSVKAKPSAAIGAALGPHLVLPNGNVSGPRACAPVEAFELPGSIAKGAPAPAATLPLTVAATPFDFHPGLAPGMPLESPGAGRGIRPPGQVAASPGARPGSAVPKPPVAPKPKAKPRPLFEGEERKRGPAGRTSMYKVALSLIFPVHIKSRS